MWQERAEWRDLAVCAEVDPELFFPPEGGASAAAYASARRICAHCPVKAQCLAEGLRADRLEPFNQGHGLWGGLSPRQRRGLG